MSSAPTLVTSILLALPAAAAAQAVGTTLPAGAVHAMISVETDTTAGRTGDVMSIAPDLHVGVTDALTLSVVSSGAARTGLRGSAGNGLCATDGCARGYDNGGVEGTYALLRGDVALAANGGLHATSLADDRYVAKLGVKLRYKLRTLTLAAAPSVTVPVSGRDAATAPARDRLWIALFASHPLGGPTSPLTGGVALAAKAPLDAVADEYELGAGASLTYAMAPGLLLGASWVQGRLVTTDRMVPAGMHGYDFRALQAWVSATY